MKQLIKDSPRMEILMQAILYRVYSEGQPISVILDTLTEDQWQDIKGELQSIDARRVVEYMLKKEIQVGEAELSNYRDRSSKELGSIKTWVIKTVVRYGLVLLTAVVAYLTYTSPMFLESTFDKILTFLTQKEP